MGDGLLRQHQQHARVVTRQIYVLAVSRAREREAAAEFPCGNVTVANQSDQVGRNLADHPVSLVYALVDKPVYGYRGPISTSGVESVRDGSFRKYRGAFRMEIGNDGWLWPIGDPYTTPANFVGQGMWGAQLARKVSDTLTRQLRIGALAEQIPNPQYRVALSGQLDVLGIPHPQLTYGSTSTAGESQRGGDGVGGDLQGMIAKPVVQYKYIEYVDANGTVLPDTSRNTDPRERRTSSSAKVGPAPATSWARIAWAPIRRRR